MRPRKIPRRHTPAPPITHVALPLSFLLWDSIKLILILPHRKRYCRVELITLANRIHSHVRPRRNFR
jgi:hypothetical protein